MACYALQKVHSCGDSFSKKLTEDTKNTTEQVTVNDKSVWDIIMQGVMWNSSARLEENDGSNKLVTDPWITKGNVSE